MNKIPLEGLNFKEGNNLKKVFLSRIHPDTYPLKWFPILTLEEPSPNFGCSEPNIWHWEPTPTSSGTNSNIRRWEFLTSSILPNIQILGAGILVVCCHIWLTINFWSVQWIFNYNIPLESSSNVDYIDVEIRIIWSHLYKKKWVERQLSPIFYSWPS